MYFFKNTGVWANLGVEEAVNVIIGCFSIEQRKHLELYAGKTIVTFREQLINKYAYKRPAASKEYIKFHLQALISKNPGKFRTSNKNGEQSKFFLSMIADFFSDGPKDLVVVEKVEDDYDEASV